MQDNKPILRTKFNDAILAQLKNPFPPKLLKYRVGVTNKDKTKGIPLFYITARDIFARLDQVVGFGNWKKETHIVRDEGKTVYARTTIFILINNEWVGRDGIGTPSQSEPEKGCESDSIKRAAIAWGIGRFLYYLPNNLWLPINEYHQFKEDPRKSLPTWAYPQEVEDWEKTAIQEYQDNGDADFELMAETYASDEEKALLKRSEEIRKAILARGKES